MKRFIPAFVAVGAAALMLAPSLASAAPKAHAAAFRGDGKTSQGGKVVLLLASSGRRVQMQVAVPRDTVTAARHSPTARRSPGRARRVGSAATTSAA